LVELSALSRGVTNAQYQNSCHSVTGSRAAFEVAVEGLELTFSAVTGAARFPPAAGFALEELPWFGLAQGEHEPETQTETGPELHSTEKIHLEPPTR
jgi:hypothetical protein